MTHGFMQLLCLLFFVGSLILLFKHLRTRVYLLWLSVLVVVVIASGGQLYIYKQYLPQLQAPAFLHTLLSKLGMQPWPADVHGQVSVLEGYKILQQHNEINKLEKVIYAQQVRTLLGEKQPAYGTVNDVLNSDDKSHPELLRKVSAALIKVSVPEPSDFWSEEFSTDLSLQTYEYLADGVWVVQQQVRDRRPYFLLPIEIHNRGTAKISELTGELHFVERHDPQRALLKCKSITVADLFPGRSRTLPCMLQQRDVSSEQLLQLVERVHYFELLPVWYRHNIKYDGFTLPSVTVSNLVAADIEQYHQLQARDERVTKIAEAQVSLWFIVAVAAAVVWIGMLLYGVFYMLLPRTMLNLFSIACVVLSMPFMWHMLGKTYWGTGWGKLIPLLLGVSVAPVVSSLLALGLFAGNVLLRHKSAE